MRSSSNQLTCSIALVLYLFTLCHQISASESPTKELIKTAAKKKASKMIQQKFYDSVNANIISAAMLSSAGAFNKYSSPMYSKHQTHHSHRTSYLSPAHTATSSFFRPVMRAVFKEAFAYLASPFFMPIAVGRAMLHPPGLPPQDKLMRRFARYMVREIVLGDKTQSELEENFKNKFLEYLTKDRKNMMLSMKQFRNVSQGKKSITSNEDKSDGASSSSSSVSSEVISPSKDQS